MKRLRELPLWKRLIIVIIFWMGYIGIYYLLGHYTMLPFLVNHRHMPKTIIEAAESGSVSQVRKFLENGANPNSHDYRLGRTPLSIAIDKGNIGVIKLLLSHGVDTHMIAEGDPALHRAISRACETGDEEPARVLIAYGADVNEKALVEPGNGFPGFTPLHELAACWDWGHHPKDLVLLLISKGADVNARDKKGITPLGYAVGPHRTDIAQLLKDHGAKM